MPPLVDKCSLSCHLTIRNVKFLCSFLTCVLLLGCRGSQTIWTAEVRSPDGQMLASARTIAQSGFGTGYVGTIVYLNWTTGSQPPMEILGLSDKSETPGDIGVEMHWLTPIHLELAYKGDRQSIDFQAVKFAAINISVHDLSSKTMNVTP
jgi:hypothetical protein